MTTQELEQQLLRLPPIEKLRLFQLLAQSLNILESDAPQSSPIKISTFFQQSPLAEAAATGELDLERDRSLPLDRSTL